MDRRTRVDRHQIVKLGQGQRVFPQFLSRRQLDAVDVLVRDLEGTYNDQWPRGSTFRHAEARWIESKEESRELHSWLEELFGEANRTFDFQIERIEEPILHASYDEGGHFSWHTDAGPGPTARRKLSVSILLSDPGDFDGGQLEFCPGGPLKNELRAGSAIVFPAFMAHRVTPVVRGRRRALVAWIHGPEFR